MIDKLGQIGLDEAAGAKEDTAEGSSRRRAEKRDDDYVANVASLVTSVCCYLDFTWVEFKLSIYLSLCIIGPLKWL